MFKYELRRDTHCVEIATPRTIQLLKDRATLATIWERETHTGFDDEVQIQSIPYYRSDTVVIVDLDMHSTIEDRLCVKDTPRPRA